MEFRVKLNHDDWNAFQKRIWELAKEYEELMVFIWRDHKSLDIEWKVKVGEKEYSFNAPAIVFLTMLEDIIGRIHFFGTEYFIGDPVNGPE